MTSLLHALLAPVRRGLLLREEPYGRLFEVDEATVARLRQYTPIVALHRAGNAIERIEPAVRAGVLVETDVQVHSGRFVAEHEHRAGLLSYDWQRWLWRLGHAPFPLEPVLGEAQRLNARLLLDLKMDVAWAPALVGLLKRYKLLPSAAFTGEWDALDAIRAYGVETGGFNYGGMNRWWKLERFLQQQGEKLRPGVSLHKKLASEENIERLHASGAQVLVYVVSEPNEALEMLRRGADGLITNNLALAEVWSAKAA